MAKEYTDKDMRGYTIDCFDDSVVTYSLVSIDGVMEEEEVKEEECNDTNDYDVVFEEFVRRSDIGVLYDYAKGSRLELNGKMFTLDKTVQFEEWFNREYDGGMNTQIFDIMSTQLSMLSEVEVYVSRAEYTSYIGMYIRISMATKMLELLIPLYRLLQSRGEEGILLREYCDCETVAVNSGTLECSPAGTLSCEYFDDDLIDDTRRWYSEIYRWVVGCVRDIIYCCIVV